MMLDMLQAKAMALSHQNPKHPYAAVIATASGEIVAEGINDVSSSPLRHAEMVALENLLAGDNKHLPLEDLILVTTAEPCPMCAGAIFWAGIGQVAYGTRISTLQNIGVKQLALPAKTLLSLAARPPKIVEGVLEAECDALFEQAAKLKSREQQRESSA